MEETKDNSELNEQPKKSKKKKVWVIVICAIIALVVISSITSYDSSGKEELELYNLNLNYEYTEYLGYTVTITGTAKNTSGNDLSYASVEFSVYDEYGNNLGMAIDNINHLAKGDTWQFEAILLNFQTNRPVSYKLVEITTW